MKNIEEHPQGAAFLAALAEDRYDAVTRRVFADWLEENGYDDEAVVQREWTREKHEDAEAFMEEYAGDIYRSVEEVLEAATGFLETGSLTETHGVHHVHKSGELTGEFWEHFVVLTGRPVATDKRTDTPYEGCCQRDFGED